MNTGLSSLSTTVSSISGGVVEMTASLSTTNSKVESLGSGVAASMGGGASYDASTGKWSAPSYTVHNADGSTSQANSVGDAINSINTKGTKYFHANSTLADSSATGSNAVAVGPQAVASGASAVAMGHGAQASGAQGTALGFGAIAQSNGGVAIGAGSVSTREAGVAGFVAKGATESQAAAVQATTSTKGAVAVGSEGETRQITGVAAGSEDTDAANVAQIKAINGDLSQVNGQINNLQNQIQDVARSAYSGTAMSMALSGAYMPNLEPGEKAVGAGVGSYKGYTALAVTYKQLAGNGKMAWGAGVSTTGREVGVNAGVGWKWR